MMTQKEIADLDEADIELTTQAIDDASMTLYFKHKERCFVIEVWQVGDIFHTDYALIATLEHEKDHLSLQTAALKMLLKIKKIIEGKESCRLPFLVGTYTWKDENNEI